MDQQGNQLWDQPFAVEGEAKETDAARQLSRTPGDQNIRRVTGTVSGVGELTVNINGQPKSVRVPKLTNTTLDAPPAKVR